MYEVFLTNNITDDTERAVISSEECSGLNCSTELNVPSNLSLHSSTSYHVAIFSRDVFGYYSEGIRVDFTGAIGESRFLMKHIPIHM